MSAENKVLSQAEIDAMLSASVEPPSAPVNALDPPIPPTVRAQAPVTARRVYAETSPDALSGMNARLEALEAAARNDAGEKTLVEITAAIKELQQNVQAITAYLQSLRNEVDTNRQNAQASPAHGLHKTFVCKSCETQGMVATAIRCTQCGWEGWWGWYPPQEK